jgi:hypothetical protein
MNRSTGVRLGILILLLLLSGCVKVPVKEVTNSVDNAVAVLDKGISKLEGQSVTWQRVLEETRDELIEEGQSTLANEVSNVLSAAIDDVGIEARCYTDFLQDRVREDLIRIRARLTGEELILTPVFCNPNPKDVEYALVREGRLNSVVLSGYNLDVANVKVSLVDQQGKKTDATRYLANPTQYLLTLNLGGNGVPLQASSDKLVFVLGNNEIRSINVIQPVVPSLKLQRWPGSTSEAAAHPAARVEVPIGWKILGGGARVNWTGAGNLLTASYPESLRVWVAESKDHRDSDPASIDVWAIAVWDPEDQWDVRIFPHTSEKTSHPSATVLVDSGYLMTGGGARVDYGDGDGNLLTASFPLSANAWQARSKDHMYASQATITAYAIGIKPRTGENHLEVKLFPPSESSSKEEWPKHQITVDGGYVLTGGGALVNWQGSGNLLTASYPVDDRTWEATSKSHVLSSPATITVYAIGVKQ